MLMTRRISSDAIPDGQFGAIPNGYETCLGYRTFQRMSKLVLYNRGARVGEREYRGGQCYY
ncbi:MAG TPA: hypothetical protein P5121_02825 [Caldilineaceae bacterium]|nr:hypothetical protein [Caldilineaceae bacterium]